MQPIILCGGLGKRLWPLSTKDLPKQFLRLGSNLSFFQKTLIRLNFYDNPIIIGSYLHKDLIYHQMKEVGIDGLVVLEEKVTGTYLPILFGIILSSYLGKNKVGIFPTDHFIKDEHYFLYNINQAIELSNSSKIVTFGQRADFFNKNYGHIIAINKYQNIYLCNKFIEKPQNIDLNFHLRPCFWNLGIFIFKTDLLNNLFQNDYKIIQFYLKNIDITKDFTIKKNIYNYLKQGSFDIIIMNKFIEFYMIAANFQWMDIGSFKNLYLYYKEKIYTSSKIRVEKLF